ncbi:hypothetical protein SDC9_210156 [bioreactor metagenome]|uniref:Uncharacterized protein n=1 Tax=bioreactor metagenome TaxID=1076179 RepID=A0A645JI86_9ZZZZ
MHIDHRAGAGKCRAHAAADNKCLRNGGVDDPAGELLRQTLELTEDPALTGQVLAHDKDLIVLGHGLRHGLAGRLSEC